MRVWLVTASASAAAAAAAMLTPNDISLFVTPHLRALGTLYTAISPATLLIHRAPHRPKDSKTQHPHPHPHPHPHHPL
jgi:hypothetical protein